MDFLDAECEWNGITERSQRRLCRLVCVGATMFPDYANVFLNSIAEARRLDDLDSIVEEV